MKRRLAVGGLGGFAGTIRLVARVCPWAGIGTLSFGVVSGVCGAPAVWLTKRLVDDLVEPRNGSTLSIVALAIGAALLTGLANSMAYAGGIPAARLAAKVRIETESQLAATCGHYVGTDFLDDPARQDELHLAQRGAHEAPEAVTNSITGMFSALSGILAYLVLLYTAWPAMLAALILTAIPIALVQRRINRRAVTMAQAATVSYRWRDYYSALFSNPVSARDMRLHGAEQLFVGRLRQHLSTALRAEVHQQNRTAYGQVAFTIINAIIGGVGAAVVAIAVAQGHISVGDFVMFTVAVAAVQSRFSTVLGLAGHLSVSLGIFAHYLAFVAGPPEQESSVAALPAEPLRGGLELRDVWFRYSVDGDWILRGVNLWLAAGRTHALVGLNGAGKSTLVKLILRYYDPSQGQVLWDGVDIKRIDPSSLRRRVSAVLQDYVTYELTAVDNITIGDLSRLGDATQARMTAARANVLDTVEQLPCGFATMLSTRRSGDQGAAGVTLSGGEWQRIALARAMMRDDADLLILDEPNAGLDPAAEYELHTDLMGFGTGSTRLLISHRLGCVRHADQIIVLAGGMVEEVGTHEDLMQATGTYCRLFSLQASGYLDVEEGALR